MASSSSRFKSVGRCGSVVVPALFAAQALIVAPQRAAAQAPPRDVSTPNRSADAPRNQPQPSNISETRHPLDPLEPREIELAVATVRKDRQLSDNTRFVTVTLNEPPKEVVRPRNPEAPGRARRC